jgi:hypothetical protein
LCDSIMCMVRRADCDTCWGRQQEDVADIAHECDAPPPESLQWEMVVTMLVTLLLTRLSIPMGLHVQAELL